MDPTEVKEHGGAALPEAGRLWASVGGGRRVRHGGRGGAAPSLESASLPVRGTAERRQRARRGGDGGRRGARGPGVV